MGQESRHNFARTAVAKNTASRTTVGSRRDQGKPHFGVRSGGCWQDSVPLKLLCRGPGLQISGCHLKVYVSSLSYSFTTEQLKTQLLISSEQTHEGKQDGGQSLFCSLISEPKTHHFCHILLVENKSLGPVHTWGAGSHWGHFKGCLPQRSLK